MGMPAGQSAMMQPQQQQQPNFQAFLQRLQQARMRGLFGQAGQGAQRFMPGQPRAQTMPMQAQPVPQMVQQAAVRRFQRPLPPAMDQGLFAPQAPLPVGSQQGYGDFANLGTQATGLGS